MKCYIDENEVYPVLSLHDASDPGEAWRIKDPAYPPLPPVDIPPELWDRYQAAYKEWDSVQTEICNRYNSQ